MKRLTKAFVGVVIAMASMIGVFHRELEGKGNNPNATTAKRPMPSLRDQHQAEQTIRSLFRKEYADRTPVGKLALAAKLLSQGLATEEDVALRFVCFREARDLAAAGGDLTMAFSALDAMDREFVVDVADLRIATFTTAAPLASAEAAPAAVEAGLALLDQAMSAEDFSSANRILTALNNAVIKSKQLPLVSKVQAKRAELIEIQKEAGAVKGSKEILKKEPNDPAANLVVGRFLALQKSEWGEALPLLAKGSDETLKGLSQRELNKPAAPKDWLQLADGWWDAAEKQGEGARARIRLHAGELYATARPGLSGADATRATERLPKFAPSVALTPAPAAGPAATPGPIAAVKPGPVPSPAAVAADEQPLHALAVAGKAGLIRSISTPGDVRSVQMTPDDQRVLAVARGSHLWHIDSGKEIGTWPGWGVQLLPDGKRILVEDRGKWILADAETGKELSVVSGTGGGIASLSADGSRAVISRDVKDEGIITLYDLKTPAELKKFQHKFGNGQHAVISPDNKIIVTAQYWGDSFMHGWEVSSDKEIWHGDNGGGCDALAFVHGSSKLIRDLHSNNCADICDGMTGQLIARCDSAKTHSGAVIASTGRFVVTGSSDTRCGLHLFSLASIKDKLHVKPLDGWPRTEAFGPVNAIALSPDDRRVLAACKDKSVRLIDVQTGKQLAKFDHDDEVKRVAFSPDGHFAVSADFNVIRVWRLP